MRPLFRPVLQSLCLLAVLPLQAQLARYGYVVGTFVPGSNHLEPISQQGTFLHYRFKVQTPVGQYECVIDVKNGHKQLFPYRILDIDPANTGYGSVFGSADGLHSITMTPSGGTQAQGALDYIRHPGILQDLTGRPWAYQQAQPTGNPDQYKLADWDALFVGVKKIYVWGEPYGSGLGLHVVHQNQGDPSTTGFARSNGSFQDGAVIFEYEPVKKCLWWMQDQWTPPYVWRCYLPVTLPSRKLLMVKFGTQSDFTYTNDPDGTGTLHPGVAAPAGVNTYSVSLASGATQDFGPFNAEQFQAETAGPTGNVDIYVRKDAAATETSYDVVSQNTGTTPEFVRRFGYGSYYVRLKARNGAASCTFKVTTR